MYDLRNIFIYIFKSKLVAISGSQTSTSIKSKNNSNPIVKDYNSEAFASEL